MVSKKPVTPFFSIITCTRNSSKFIRKCLESVKSQTFQDFEHIIIDGKSSDDTHQIIEEYGLRYHVSEPLGIAEAMNDGLGYAKGQYIYFLNSDDSFYSNQVLQKIHDYLVDHPKLDWVFGNIHETDGHLTIGYPPKRKIFQGKHPNILKFYNYIPHQATFIKKSVFNKFGVFNEKLKSMMDPEYWLRIAPHTQWGYMPIIVANYLIRSDSQSENLDNAKSNTKEYEYVQSKYLSKSELVLAKLINKLLR
jgi:glycosyltransferase involved in cell wall biosynthesis